MFGAHMEYPIQRQHKNTGIEKVTARESGGLEWWGKDKEASARSTGGARGWWHGKKRKIRRGGAKLTGQTRGNEELSNTRWEG